MFKGRIQKCMWGGGRKNPFFYNLKKVLEPYEKQEKLIKINCMLCSVLVNIDQ